MSTTPLEQPPADARRRVLIVGRSPSVLEEAARVLTSRGYRADVTNAFDRVLDDYDVTDVDVLVLGQMVPPDTKERLRAEVSGRNPRVRHLDGLVGIPGIIAAQVESAAAGEPSDGIRVTYDAAARSFVIDLDAPEQVAVDAFWVSSFAGGEPASAQVQVLVGELPTGRHVVRLPDEVPAEAAFAVVAVGRQVQVFTVAPVPAAVLTGRRLPEVRTVATHARAES